MAEPAKRRNLRVASSGDGAGTGGTVLPAVEALLATMELDELGEARAALARTLATKLDQLLWMDAAQVQQAIPALSKELREVLDALQEASDDSADYVTNLFASVGDSANT